MKKAIDRMLTAMSIFVATLTVAFVTGVIWYNEVSEQQYTVVVRLKTDQDPFQTLPQIVPIAAKITEVETLNKEANEYQLTVKTSQNRKRLLDFILGNKQVETAR
jgi:hypothetical protein